MDNLINEVLSNVDFRKVSTILLPYAQEGRILDEIQDRRSYTHFDIDTIESDYNFIKILKNKDYRVVHNEFLTYTTQKRYDLIIMSPPLITADKYLLKALDMQKNGGAIICTISAKTIKSPYTDEENNLVRKLTELNASTTYYFDEVEHEIAIVKVFVPVKENISYIWENITNHEEKKENIIQEITIDNYIKTIVNAYNNEIKAGGEFINEYKALKPFILQQFNNDYPNSMLNLSLRTGFQNTDEVTINDFIKEIRGKYWKTLFSNNKFIGKLTTNLQHHYWNKISELKNYEFSLYNIYTIRNEMQQNMAIGIENTILELFEEFSNRYSLDSELSKNIHYYNGWKTNKSWKVNNKVIIRLNGFSCYKHYRESPTYSVYFPSETRSKLSDMEKVFNYLDGNLTENIDLDNILDYAVAKEQSQNIITNFFDITFHKKGTCHITFRNIELLHKFNIFGSQRKNWLPPSYGKVKYEDMSEEEKDVIDNFEGKESYQKTLLNTNYYIVDTNKLLELED